jgi:hypothetical protein
VALLEGEEFGSSDLLDAHFDAPIPKERFRFEPPADAPVRSVEELRRLAAVPEHQPIEAAAARTRRDASMFVKS